mmetsp:Transcript_25095/g.38349  ORF Transcript_25095/g.38349 Transcript_25095/m.38349 type:complete len:219 (-) Transcript_25095:42-698(-)
MMDFLGRSVPLWVATLRIFYHRRPRVSVFRVRPTVGRRITRSGYGFEYSRHLVHAHFVGPVSAVFAVLICQWHPQQIAVVYHVFQMNRIVWDPVCIVVNQLIEDLRDVGGLCSSGLVLFPRRFGNTDCHAVDGGDRPTGAPATGRCVPLHFPVDPSFQIDKKGSAAASTATTCTIFCTDSGPTHGIIPLAAAHGKALFLVKLLIFARIFSALAEDSRG